MTADLFPEAAPASSSGLWWRRVPFSHSGKADYYLMRGAQATGYAVRYCGHPTALRPYYIEDSAGVLAGVWRSSVEARAVVLAAYLLTRPI